MQRHPGPQHRGDRLRGPGRRRGARRGGAVARPHQHTATGAHAARFTLAVLVPDAVDAVAELAGRLRAGGHRVDTLELDGIGALVAGLAADVAGG